MSWCCLAKLCRVWSFSYTRSWHGTFTEFFLQTSSWCLYYVAKELEFLDQQLKLMPKACRHMTNLCWLGIILKKSSLLSHPLCRKATSKNSAIKAHAYVTYTFSRICTWLSGVVVTMSDLRLAVVGSNPGHGTTCYFSEVSFWLSGGCNHHSGQLSLASLQSH